MSASTSQATSDRNDEFFNLHTNGVGYLNRVRRVPVKGRGRKAEEFLACSIAAMRGPKDDLSYTYFDCRVSGTEAQEIVERLQQDVESDHKVVIGFCIGDVYTHLYERDKRNEQRQKTGGTEWAALIKGRLIRIDFVTIDGKRVYTRERHDDEGEPMDPDGQDGNDGGMSEDENTSARGESDGQDVSSDNFGRDVDHDRDDDEYRTRRQERREPQQRQTPSRQAQQGELRRTPEQRSFAGDRHSSQRAERQRWQRDEVPA